MPSFSYNHPPCKLEVDTLLSTQFLVSLSRMNKPIIAIKRPTMPPQKAIILFIDSAIAAKITAIPNSIIFLLIALSPYKFRFFSSTNWNLFFSPFAQFKKTINARTNGKNL